MLQTFKWNSLHQWLILIVITRFYIKILHKNCNFVFTYNSLVLLNFQLLFYIIVNCWYGFHTLSQDLLYLYAYFPFFLIVSSFIYHIYIQNKHCVILILICIFKFNQRKIFILVIILLTFMYALRYCSFWEHFAIIFTFQNNRIFEVLTCFALNN